MIFAPTERHLVPIPIGGHAAMGAEEAGHALREWTKPGIAIPTGYGTKLAHRESLAQLVQVRGDGPLKAQVMKPGEKIALQQIKKIVPANMQGSEDNVPRRGKIPDSNWAAAGSPRDGGSL